MSDPKDGNQSLHISAQNGHLGLTKFLLAHRANVNAKNRKEQTPLHMSVEYDFYFQSVFLIDARADPSIRNVEGHAAEFGIGGKKVDNEAWNHPFTILKAAGDDPQQVEFAFKSLEQANLSGVSKEDLAKIGLRKKKECGANWNAARFRAVLNKL